MITFSVLEIVFYRLYNRKVSKQEIKIFYLMFQHLQSSCLQFHPWEKIINGEIVDYDAPVDEEVVEEEVNKEEVKVEIETSC